MIAGAHLADNGGDVVFGIDIDNVFLDATPVKLYTGHSSELGAQ